MIGVVDGGTAGRLNGIYTDAESKPLVVGGKTGTGDHRKEIYGAGGRLIESKFISRAAVFTFFLGDRFFGVITAYVQGNNAGLYHFTSSLPVQIVKFLKPTLSPLINNTSPVKEISKPVANVIIAENVKSVIKETNTKKVKPINKVAHIKKVKPLIREATAKVTRPLIKETTAKVTKPQVKETAAIVTKPQVKETAAIVTKPQVKEAPAIVTTPLANVALTKNSKLSVNEKITKTDIDDSATRYYKYPTIPNPPQ
jgi:hypothetical protein